MASKRNPLKLNALQLKTLTLLQELARDPNHSNPGPGQGEVTITAIPAPHGDHFHLGAAVVFTRDATGLGNQAAWIALERKGLIRSGFPDGCTLLPAGRAYETGQSAILHRANH
jgi:hypothetical protein